MPFSLFLLPSLPLSISDLSHIYAHAHMCVCICVVVASAPLPSARCLYVQLIDRLYTLVDIRVFAPVCRQALELLFLLCNFNGFSLVVAAAELTAKSLGSQSYSNLVALLSAGVCVCVCACTCLLFMSIFNLYA